MGTYDWVDSGYVERVVHDTSLRRDIRHQPPKERPELQFLHKSILDTGIAEKVLRRDPVSWRLNEVERAALIPRAVLPEKAKEYVFARLRDLDPVQEGLVNGLKRGFDLPAGAYIHGTYGNGKTHIVTAFAQLLMDRAAQAGVARRETFIADINAYVGRETQRINDVIEQMERTKGPLSTLREREDSTKLEANRNVRIDGKDYPVRFLLHNIGVGYDPEGKSYRRHREIGDKIYLSLEVDEDTLRRHGIFNENTRSKLLTSVEEQCGGPPQVLEWGIERQQNLHQPTPGETYDLLAKIFEMDKEKVKEFFDERKNAMRRERELHQKIKEYNDTLESKRKDFSAYVFNAYLSAWAHHPFTQNDVYYVGFEELFREYDNRKETYWARRPAVTIIDDVALKGDDARLTLFTDFVGTFYDERKPWQRLFFTSNASPEELCKPGSMNHEEMYHSGLLQGAGKTYSRLQELCQFVELTAPSYRAKMQQERPNPFAAR